MKRWGTGVTLAGVLALAACGGGSTSTPSDSTVPTEASTTTEAAEPVATTGAPIDTAGPANNTPAPFVPCTEEGSQTGMTNGTLRCERQDDGNLVWRQIGGESPTLPAGVTCGSQNNPENPLALPGDNANARASLNAFPVECVFPRSDCAPNEEQSQYQWYRTNQSLVVDPANHARLIVGIERLGLFESLDFGDTWKPLSEEGVLHSLAKADDTVCWPETFRITFDPAQPGRIYLHHGGGGTVESGIWQSRGGGLYVSNDNGLTWDLLTTKDMNTYTAGFSIAPSDSNTLYLGTSSAPQTDGSEPVAYVERGLVYRSTDGGTTWTELPTGWGQRTVGAVIWTDPNNPKSVLLGVFQYKLDQNDSSPAGTKLGPGWYRSSDGGDTWAQVGPAAGPDEVPSSRSAVSPDGSIIVNPYDKTWISRDGGKTWTESKIPRMIPVFDPHGDGQRIYAVTPAAYLDQKGKQDTFVVSTDGGRSWRDLGKLPVELQTNFFNEPPLYRRGTPSKITVDPVDPKIIYVSGAGGLIARSNDGGATWKLLTTVDTFTPSTARIR